MLEETRDDFVPSSTEQFSMVPNLVYQDPSQPFFFSKKSILYWQLLTKVAKHFFIITKEKDLILRSYQMCFISNDTTLTLSATDKN